MTRVLPAIAPLALIAMVVSLIALDGRSAPAVDADRGWSTFTELQRPRAFAHALTLPTGEILVVGGLDRDDPQVTNPRSELIDPLSHAVTVLSGNIVGRLHQSATLGSRERVVVAGGVVWEDEHWSPVDQVDVYDVKTRRWSAGRPLAIARSDHAAVALKDGRVAVIGGNIGTTLLASIEIYDPHTDAWVMGAPMPRPRTQHAAVTLRDGRVLVAGGIDGDGGATATTFLYDPRSNTWEAGPRMAEPRLQQATVLLPSGDVLVAGGDGNAAGSSELYLAHERRFVSAGLLAEPRLVAQAAALPDGRVVIAGGLPPRMTAYRPLASAEIWDPATLSWSPLAALAEGRAWGSLVSAGGALYLVSGTGNDERALRSIARFAID
ncbi:MAG TPA: kelch repeat-containing protein [Candidatus Limnocylindria bacterium]|nr:kelch repeat-containing protein [Candidatus Limnocylindria bacterium]